MKKEKEAEQNQTFERTDIIEKREREYSTYRDTVNVWY